MIVEVLRDGAKNLSILVKGIVEMDFTPIEILDIEKTTLPREPLKGIRLDSAAWLIQEKMGITLWWEKKEKEENLIFIMESRNGLRLDEGIPSPRLGKGWGGKIYISGSNVVGQKAFCFTLEIDKQ